MKRYVVVALAMLFTVSAVTAVRAAEDAPKKDAPAKDDAPRGDRARRGGGDRGLIAMLAKLNLNDEQKAKVKELQAALTEKMKAAREAGDREKGRAAMQEFMAAVNEILTDEQKEQLEKLRQEARKNRGDRPRDGDAPRKRPQRDADGDK